MIPMMGKVGTAAAASRAGKERAARRVERRAAEVRGVLWMGRGNRVPEPVSPVQAGGVLIGAAVLFDVAVFVMDVLL